MWRGLIAAAVVGFVLCACGGNSKPAVPISAKCAAAMKADANVGSRASDSVRLAADAETLADCRSPAEWLNAAKPWTKGGVEGCVVCGNELALKRLSGMCAGHTSEPACPDLKTQCLMFPALVECSKP
jgi:hypothetical protein